MSVEEGYVMAYEDTGVEAIHRVAVVEKSSNLVVKVLSTGETEEIAEADFFPLDEEAEQGIDDLSELHHFNEASLLINLQKRYSKNLIYTYMSSTLIILNPYTPITGLFSKANLLQYKISDTQSLPPHIFSIAKLAHKEMFEKSLNQVILISGESGAGKTESTKHVINFLTSISSDSTNDIERKIISCSPILEAFGNAKTTRNDNSSRFGKFIKLYYGPDRVQIKSASIESFLLEKSRVVSHELGERNFHIFYLMCKYCSADILNDLGLSDKQRVNLSKYEYIKGDLDAESINEKEFYDNLIEAFGINNFSDKEIKCIWQALASILCLGNIVFDESEYNENNPCKITKDSECYLKNSARLLDIDSETIKKALLYTTRNIENKEIKSPVNKINCEAYRDTMAKFLYDRLFAWIIKKLNSGLKGREGVYIGILDIYGFEVFKRNGFEQFCINYANEKLQQLTNDYIFKSEQEELGKEGLDEFINHIDFIDNQGILDLLESNPLGIFRLIDECCSLKSDDMNLMQSIQKKHKENQFLVTPKIISDNFMIKHTASEVIYTVSGFVSKNIDEVRPEIESCVSGSKDKIMKQIMKSELKTGKFLGEKFRKEINLLMQEIRTCNCFFIRCLKPNDNKQP